MRAFTLPKRGHAPADWEDGWDARALDGGGLRLAVTDGATETSFAREWAAILAQAWVDQPLVDDDAAAIAAWLAPAQARWRAGLDLGRLPWYAAEKAVAGAFAALLGVELAPDHDGATAGRGTWRAFALGDCCLFHLAGAAAGFRLRSAFPFESPGDFGLRPLLIASRADRNARLAEGVQIAQGEYAPGDRLLLASDALAIWLLRGEALGERPLRRVLACADAAEFASLIEGERAAGRLRNDDVTLLVAACPSAAPARGTRRAGQPRRSPPGAGEARGPETGPTAERPEAGPAVVEPEPPLPIPAASPPASAQAAIPPGAAAKPGSDGLGQPDDDHRDGRGAAAARAPRPETAVTVVARPLPPTGAASGAPSSLAAPRGEFEGPEILREEDGA